MKEVFLPEEWVNHEPCSKLWYVVCGMYVHDKPMRSFIYISGHEAVFVPGRHMYSYMCMPDASTAVCFWSSVAARVYPSVP